MYVILSKNINEVRVVQIAFTIEEAKEYLSELLNTNIILTNLPLDDTPLDISIFNHQETEYIVIYLCYSVNEILDEYERGYLL